jgi:hypothetical protein
VKETEQMDRVRKCTDTLRTIIAVGDLNGILIAEKALNEMVDSAPAKDRKSSLESARLVVKEHGRAGGPGSQLSIADTINDYIEKLMRGLE